MKQLLQSKTIATNIPFLLTSLIAFSGQFTTGVWHLVIPSKWLAILVVVNIFASEIYANFYPSGVLIGSGKDWTVAKWILNVCIAVLAILQAADVVQYIPQEWLAVSVPIIQGIIRAFGGATPTQLAAAPTQLAATNAKP